VLQRTGVTGNMKNTTVTVIRYIGNMQNVDGTQKVKSIKGTSIHGSNIIEAGDMGNKTREQSLTEK
jgi:hypothetical protein